MQSITHFIFGVLIQKWVESLGLPFLIALLIIIALGILSHILLDIVSISTFHPPEPQDTLFWKAFHLLILIGSIVFVVVYINYWIGMLASVIPDIADWMIIRPLYWKISGKKDYNFSFFHNKIIVKLRELAFSWLPDLRRKEWAAANELLILLIGFYLLRILYLS